MSSCITENELCVPQNSSDGFEFYITDNGVKQKLADFYDTIIFMAKARSDDPDTETLFDPKVYTITDPEQTDLNIFFTPEELELSIGTYYWELKGFRPDENVATPISLGNFKVQRTVIKSTNGEVA